MVKDPEGNFLQRHGTAIYRSLVGAGIIGGAVTFPQYATKADMARVENFARETQTIVLDLRERLTVMREENKINERQDAILKDYESRLRILERPNGR